MTNEWIEKPLEDCMAAIIDYRGKTPKKTKSGIPLITAKIIKNGAIQPITEYINADDYKSWMRRGTPLPGDVVMTTEAPLGEVAQLDDRIVALAQRVITLRGKKNILDNRFLKYLMSSSYVQHQLDGRGTGTTVKGIKQSELRRIILRFPSYLKQKSIAHILGTLDDKIDLNRRMNATLEAMAQALFKSWFVDFDPVIDNALAAGQPIPEPLQPRAAARQALGERRKPLPDEIQQQFPSRFVFSEEMGWVPEGWGINQIKEKTKSIEYGLTTSASEHPIGPRFLRITDIRGGKVYWDSVPYCKVSDSEFTKYRINEGDIFVARTGASTGENIYVNDPPKAVFASYLVRFAFKDLSISRIVGMYMRTKAYFSYISRSVGGSAQPNASAQVLASSIMIFPPIQIANEFYKIISLYDLKITKNEKESTTLANLRDTLLPKLLSGQVRVPEAEKLVEKVFS
ncbi:restriction endonuclease subunit S [candidate division KSB1 bacterium]|nr:restriction endonuclease subunit S [candidate division KSB1 bacterium]